MAAERMRIRALLSQPTRARLFAVLAELERPASTRELAGRLGLNPNGVRLHLGKLERAGLVVRSRAESTGGRPPDEWALGPDAELRALASASEAELGGWLARAVPAEPRTLQAVEAAGAEIGGELAPLRGERPLGEAILAAFTSLGYRPESEPAQQNRLRCRLRECPYREAAESNPALVCTLHRGLTRGLVEALSADAELIRFDPGEPARAGCVVEVAGAG